jgi:hypothetical protein
MRRGTSSRRRREKRRTTRQRVLCALLAAVVFAPQPATAKTAYASQRAQIMDTMVLLNPADMDFGQITPGTANGNVVMTPNGTNNGAACATNNGIIHTGLCRSAYFEGSVPFVFNLQITKPAGNQVTLVGPSGATMRLHDFTFAKGSALMLGGSATNPTYFVIGGNFSVYVGATVDVARTQQAGIYNGTFTLTFNYN